MSRSWPIKNIGEVCDVMTGGTPSKSKPEYFEGGKIKWLVSGDIHQREITDCDGRITQSGLENSNAKYLPINSVLMALNGQGKTRGTVALLRTEATCNQSLVSIAPKNIGSLLPEYLYANLHGRYEEIRKITGDSGNDRRGLNMSLVKKIEIPLPPLPEQKRVVGILDEAFAGISQAVANAEKNLANARELFESYLNDVFTRKGEGWVEKPFGKVCDFVRGPFGGSLKKSCFVDDGYAVYEQQHAIYNQFDQIRYFIDERKFNEMSRFELFSGDLIMSCSGTMGRVAIAPANVKKGIINQALLKLSPSKDLVAEFLKYWMESMNFQEQISLHSQGAAIKNVASVKVLKMIDVPVPSISVQNRVVSKLNEYLRDTQHLESIYQQKLTALTELKHSILQKAFAGELTADLMTTSLKVEGVETTSPEFTANILAFAYYRHVLRKRDKTFGHVKAQKILHLVESIGGIDLGRKPIKDAAGPNDFQHMLMAEEWATTNQVFAFLQVGRGYEFKKLSRYNAISSTFSAIRPYRKKLEKIIDLLIPMSTEEAEVFATVHAAWNELMFKGDEFDDNKIIYEARDNWHSDKMNIPVSKFRKAIRLIRDKELVPDGKAKRIGGQEQLF